MIQTLLKILFALTFSGSVAMGQITLTQDNFLRPDSFRDTSYRAPAAEVPVPQIGENQSWDYSGVTYTHFSERIFFASTNPAYPNATSAEKSSLLFNQEFEVDIIRALGNSADGFYYYGETFVDTTHSLGATTGNPNDNIRFVGGPQPYQGDALQTLRYSVTYGSMWNNAYVQETPYILSVAGFGINQVPGTFHYSTTESREVVGWGKLKLAAAEAGRTESYDALLVRLVRSATDSFFLGGMPAPTPLLDAFALQQGQVRVDTLMVFYGLSDIGVPLVNYKLSDSVVYFRPVMGNLTSGSPVAVQLSAEVSPTLVSAGAEVRVRLEQELPLGSSIFLVGRDGRSYLEQQVVGRVSTLNLPVELSTGAYYLVIADETGRSLAVSKMHVH